MTEPQYESKKRIYDLRKRRFTIVALWTLYAAGIIAFILVCKGL